MRLSKHTTVIWLALILSLIGLLVLAGLPAPTAQAGRPLPPRVTPTPVPKEDDDDDKPVGAYIELHTQNAAAGARDGPTGPGAQRADDPTGRPRRPSAGHRGRHIQRRIHGRRSRRERTPWWRESSRRKK